MQIVALIISGLFWLAIIALCRGEYQIAFSCGLPAVTIGALISRCE